MCLGAFMEKINLQPQRLLSKEPFIAVCDHVFDGDTFRISTDLFEQDLNAVEVIRLAMVDAPELKGADRARALSAKAELERLVLGKSVRIVPTRQWRDPYNRIIARVYVEHLDVGYQMILGGFARRLGR